MSVFSHNDNAPGTPFFPAETSLGRVRSPYAGMTIDDVVDGELASGSQQEFVGLALDERVIQMFFGVIALAILVVLVRSAHVQVLQHDRYVAQAEGNRSRVVWTPAERGVVYDRNGVALVRNVPDFSVALTPADLPKEMQARRDIIGRLAEILEMEPATIEEKMREFEKYPTLPVTIATSLAHEQAIRIEIESAATPAISLVKGTRRDYLQTAERPSLSHILGFEGRVTKEDIESGRALAYMPSDVIGKNGLEKHYEHVLRGSYGKRRVEVDAIGRQKKVIAEEHGTPGKNLVLTVDLELQREVEAALADGLKAAGKKRGTAIVMDPKTGDVLALVSLPGFDNNLFAKGISNDEFRALIEDEDHPLFPRAISAEVASGSVFKLVVGAAALTEGVAKPNTSFVSKGGVAIDRWWFPDWKAGGHGITNLTKAIAESVNTYFYYVGGGNNDTFEGLGVARITEYARKFGLGAPVGIDLPNEASGFLPSKEWKEKTKGERWYIGDTYHLAIGQGDILVSPLQIATMTSVFANGGALVKPRVVGAVASSDGTRTPKEPEVVNGQVVPKENIDVVRRGMRLAVTAGSARSLANLSKQVAAKTGTAQWHPTKAPHAWFTAFGPYNDPEIVVTVLIEEGEEGSRTAAPVAARIFERYFAGHPRD